MYCIFIMWPDIRSGYLVGSLILGSIWLCMYVLRPDLRKEMRFGGILLMPFSFMAPFYIPEYWNPIYFFGTLHPFYVGLEDFLFCFFVGGISAVVYEFFTQKREVRIKKMSYKSRWMPYILGVAILLGGEVLFPNSSIYTLTITGFILAVYMTIRRKDLIIQSFVAGTLFTVIYMVFFVVFNLLYPQYIPLIYQHKHLFGIYVLGIPIEELLFSFSAGAAWSIAYEYMLGYKTR